MLRSATLLLLLATTGTSVSWIRGESAEKKENRRVLKGGGGDGPCGIISAELQSFWNIADEDCAMADATRTEECIPGPVRAPGTSGCTTTEYCKLNSDPNHVCVVTPAGSECGTLLDVALSLGVNTYQIKAVCEETNINT